MSETVRSLVFIDTETTGLNSLRHEVVEVAWAIDDGEVQRLVLPHTFEKPDAFALKLNGYLDRELFLAHTWATIQEIEGLHADLTGATLVGANPAFDAGFLSAFFGRQVYGHLSKPDPWHYRLLDIQAYGMAALNLPMMPGLADLVRLLREQGWKVPESDHTAVADVEATRVIFNALRCIASRNGKAA